jgi:hypothetical protein
MSSQGIGRSESLPPNQFSVAVPAIHTYSQRRVTELAAVSMSSFKEEGLFFLYFFI